MHTHLEPDNPDAFLKQMRRRLRYLARKLLEDLRDGEKIFVHKDTHTALDEHAATAIHAALRRYGPGQLLYVVAAEDDHPVGSLEQRAGGLWIGRMPRGSTHENADLDAWLKICDAVAEAVPATAARTSVEASR